MTDTAKRKTTAAPKRRRRWIDRVTVPAFIVGIIAAALVDHYWVPGGLW